MNKIAIIPIMFLLMLTISSQIVHAFTNTTIYCDGDTLIENVTFYIQGNETNLWLPVNCTYGCDNITNTCNPPVYQQNIGLFIIIGIIGVILFLLVRRFK